MCSHCKPADLPPGVSIIRSRRVDAKGVPLWSVWHKGEKLYGAATHQQCHAFCQRLGGRV